MSQATPPSQDPQAAVDLIVRGTVVTVDPDRTVLADAAVAVKGERIVAVGKWDEVSVRFDAAQVLGDATSLVTPGMVNTHQHLTGDRLMRSAIPDNLAPGEAIYSWVVPGHAAHEPADDYLSATLGLAEAVGNGITTTVEAGTVAHPAEVARAFATIGVRGTVGGWGWDSEGQPFAYPADEVLARQRATADELADAPLVTPWVTLVGHDLMTDELVKGASDLAVELETGLTFHMSPADTDATSYLARTGKRPLVHLNDLGALGPHVLLGHAVHLDDAEFDVLATTDTAVAYCPWAYLRLGQGVTGNGRHLEMTQRGIRVGLGCDAENAGDSVDMLRTAALTAGLAKDMPMDPVAFGAHDALAMATIGGAAAIGQADLIGSIEVGKMADLVVHDTTGVQWQPRSPDPVLQLVWASDGRSVQHVVTNGNVVVRDTKVLGADLLALSAEVAERSASLFQRSGVTPNPTWPVR